MKLSRKLKRILPRVQKPARYVGGEWGSIVKDKEGFLFPEIDTTRCVQCEMCEKACPQLNPQPLQ